MMGISPKTSVLRWYTHRLMYIDAFVCVCKCDVFQVRVLTFEDVRACVLEPVRILQFI